MVEQKNSPWDMAEVVGSLITMFVYYQAMKLTLGSFTNQTEY